MPNSGCVWLGNGFVFPPRFWSASLHAYVEKQQRSKYEQTKVTGRSRTPREAVERGFSKPKQKQSWLGMPSVCVSAAVVKGVIILRHSHAKPWDGEASADSFIKGRL